MNIHLFIYCEELAHAIMKAKMSHDLPSINWRLGKADGIIQFNLKA